MIKQVQKLILIVLLWLSLPTFLLTTNPEALPLPLLITPFILLGLALYMTCSHILRAVAPGMSSGRSRSISGIATFLPILLLVLASIGQLTIMDVAIVFGLLAVLIFYLKRIDFIKT